MSKLEEVVLAIRCTLHGRPAGAPVTEALYEAVARAAVEALREPTDAAVLRGAEACELYGNTDARSTWYAMLDEILDEPQTSSKPLPSSDPIKFATCSTEADLIQAQGPEITQAQIEAMERGGK